jgi:tetratricopeptide (TPR) repeat protein
MEFLYYFMGSVVLGIIPGIIAKRAKRSFFLWWLYGALLFPPALLHSIFIALKLKKAMPIAYVFVIVYGIGIFYFATWFLATQPVSIEQADITEAKYKVSSLILDNPDSLTPDRIPDFRKYAAEQTKLKEKNINLALDYFEQTMLGNRDKLVAFAIDMLKSIEKNYKFVSEKGAFEEFSVPMGASSRVFRTYIDSLVLLNKYSENDVSSLESNYESILSTEETYFKTTKYSEPFLEHLNDETKKELPKDRMLVLIDHYLSIGNLLVGNGQTGDAIRCYDSAISLYAKIIELPGLTLKDKIGYYYKIAEACDKKSESESILNTFDRYLSLFFAGSLYTDKDSIEELPRFMKLKTIAEKHENLIKAINTFMKISETNKRIAEQAMASMENTVLNEIFSRLSVNEKNNYAKVIDDNYKILISSNELSTLPTIEKAFNFFEQYRFANIANSYLDRTKKLFDDLIGKEKQLIEDYTVLSGKIDKAEEVIVAILEKTVPATKTEKQTINTLKEEIGTTFKTLDAINTDIKNGRQVIAKLIDPKAINDEAFVVETSTKDAMRELEDNYALIQDKIK